MLIPALGRGVNRPNGARVAAPSAGSRYPSATPRDPSPPKRFARCDTRELERETVGSLLSLSGSLLLLDGPPGPRFAVGPRSSRVQPMSGASVSSSRSRRSRRRRLSRRSLRANSTASVRLCNISRAACRRRAWCRALRAALRRRLALRERAGEAPASRDVGTAIDSPCPAIAAAATVGWCGCG